jgi:hypothetical protein
MSLPSYLRNLQTLVGGTIHEATRHDRAHLRVEVGPFYFVQCGGADARYVTADRLDAATKRPGEYLDFRRADLADEAKATAPALAEAMGRAIARWAGGDHLTPRPDMVTQALAVAPPPIAAGIRAELAVIRAAIVARHAAELATLDAIDPKEAP